MRLLTISLLKFSKVIYLYTFKWFFGFNIILLSLSSYHLSCLVKMFQKLKQYMLFFQSENVYCVLENTIGSQWKSLWPEFLNQIDLGSLISEASILRMWQLSIISSWGISSIQLLELVAFNYSLHMKKEKCFWICW